MADKEPYFIPRSDTSCLAAYNSRCLAPRFFKGLATMRSLPRFPCGHLRWRGVPVTISLTSSECRFLYLILMRERAEYAEQRDFAQVRLIDALHRQLGAPGAQAVSLSLGL